MIVPVVVTDGRGEFLERTISSILANVDHLSYPGVMVDDSGDPAYAQRIETNYGRMFRYIHHQTRQGLAAGILHGWAEALTDPAVEYVWHHEDDYVIPAPLDLWHLAAMMRAEPSLAELTLKRGPYSPEEHAAGGYMEVGPSDYEDVSVLEVGAYVRHDQLFFFQPSLIPRGAVALALASGIEITEPNLAQLLVRSGYHFGVVGRIADAPLVEHVGTYRSAGWKI